MEVPRVVALLGHVARAPTGMAGNPFSGAIFRRVQCFITYRDVANPSTCFARQVTWDNGHQPILPINRPSDRGTDGKALALSASLGPGCEEPSEEMDPAADEQRNREAREDVAEKQGDAERVRANW